MTETTYVTIGGVSDVTNISGALTDEHDIAAPVDSFYFDDLFIFEGKLDAGTYYLKVTGKDGTETGRYTVRAILDHGRTIFVNRCSNISRSAAINDPLYGCQWHLNNNTQFRNGAGQDIKRRGGLAHLHGFRHQRGGGGRRHAPPARGSDRQRPHLIQSQL